MSSTMQKEVSTACCLWCVCGICGVHRCYLDDPGTGCCMLLTGGCFVLGCLCDGCRIPEMVAACNAKAPGKSYVVLPPSPVRPPGAPGRALVAPRPSGVSSSPAAVFADQSLVVSANRINLVLVVDRSGSMSSNGRWTSVQRGVQSAMSNLADSDIATVVAFNDKVQVFGPDVKRDLDLRGFLRLDADGGTALYDATLTALTASLQLHLMVDAAESRMNVLTYIVVMTDGEDQSSKSSLRDVQTALQRVNHLRGFKITFAGVSLSDTGRAAMRSLASIGDADITYRDLHDGDGAFNDFFEHIAVSLRTRIIGVRT